MLDHPFFDKYAFEEIPLDRDIYLMDEVWLYEYEKQLLATFQGSVGEHEPVGYGSFAAARSVNVSSIDLSWYPNFFDRFHEVAISLPRDQFIACVGSSQYDEKPHLFIKNGWLDRLHLRTFSVFALIDAIDVKSAIKNGLLTRKKLIQLRDRIDALAARYPEISFISFADSLLLKSNWNVGMYNSDIEYSYSPEILIRLVSDIQSAYRDVLNFGVYAVLTQGSNEYYEDPLLHISTTKNHICLNSLGLPFSQLKSIENAARAAIKSRAHEPAELYMDKQFFNSLKFVFKFQKGSCSKNTYREPLTGKDGEYVCANCQDILDSLQGPESLSNSPNATNSDQ